MSTLTANHTALCESHHACMIRYHVMEIVKGMVAFTLWAKGYIRTNVGNKTPESVFSFQVLGVQYFRNEKRKYFFSTCVASLECVESLP